MNTSNVVSRLLFVATAISVPVHAQIVSLPGFSASSSAGGNLTFDDGVDAWTSSESRTSRRGDPVRVTQSSGPVSYDAGASAAAGSLSAFVETQWVAGGEWPYGNAASAGASAQTVDYFVITGGTGIAAAGVRAEIEGSQSVSEAGSFNGSSSYEFRLSYELLQTPPCHFEPGGCTPADTYQSVLSEGRYLSGNARPIRFANELETDFLFRYDQPFRLATYLGVNGSYGGDADLAGTATYLLNLPAGATLVSASGFGYVAAVPEPGTYALLLLGLAGLGLDQRRRAQRNR